jgi:prepilin-type N-terminal cleavage/methylation domain-containing protein
VRRGFTVVELIIVIAVIGILATIALVTYNGSQNRAYDSGVQSDLDSSAGLIEGFRVNLSDTHRFPASAADLTSAGLLATKKSYDQTTATNFVYCVNTSDYQSYALAALSKSGKTFVITQDGFQTSVLTSASFANASTICSGLSLSLVSSGMSPAGTWQSWVVGGS